MEPVKEPILLVDDEPNVLSGYKRQLRKAYVIRTAESGPQALSMLDNSGPYAVVVSDMRMPQMNGIEFLSEVRLRSPESVRIMLTGNADLQTCIDAVNEGCIFRFLTKPCESEVLAQTLDAGLTQFRLIRSERELLQGTLKGCIRTLTDILGLLNPAAFSRATRLCRYVRHIAAQVGVKHFWEYEMAATLSHIGCIALPPELLARMQAGRSLTSEQMGVLANHPNVGCQLLAEIPRLEMVAEIIALQNRVPRKKVIDTDNMNEEQAIEFGGQLLRCTLDLDALLMRGLSFIDALSVLHKEYGPDHPLIAALMSYEERAEDRVRMQTTAEGLSPSMAADEDITTKDGHIVVSKGQRFSDPVRFHLEACSKTGVLKEPFWVVVINEAR